ncbi:RIP metalloprotease RseP [Marinicellulosiphila megalodicopiae]|uniref:RIP metalloprotease RseP n=1 Tax=Marinicellulosiphila megalodicopiae TaxID=2724896 RepID=UPI003BAEFDBC
MLWNILFFVVAILILVSFHEWGHYLIARLFKVKIITFSVGFGQKLIKWRNKKDTEFVISAIPLGGFVRMAGSQEKDSNNLPIELKEGERYYDTLPPIKRIAISLAGPLFNFILAYLLYALIFTHPIAQQDLHFNEVVPDSIAANAGIPSGITITAFDGKSFETLREFRLYLYRFAGQSSTVNLEYEYNGELKSGQLYIDQLDVQSAVSVISQLGLIQTDVGYQVFAQTINPGAAHIAGMQAGDRWIKINGVPITSDAQWRMAIAQGDSIDWTVLRDGDEIDLILRPKRDETKKHSPYLIGVQVQSNALEYSHIIEQNLTIFESALYSFKYTWEMIKFNVISIVKLIKGDLGLDNLGGPGTMANASGSAAKSGFLSFLSLLGILSISLGVINLLPIPMLDGGNVLFDTIELIRRKPLSESWQIRFKKIGLLIVVSVMAVAITNDLFRYL